MFKSTKKIVKPTLPHDRFGWALHHWTLKSTKMSKEPPHFYYTNFHLLANNSWCCSGSNEIQRLHPYDYFFGPSDWVNKAIGGSTRPNHTCRSKRSFFVFCLGCHFSQNFCKLYFTCSFPYWLLSANFGCFFSSGFHPLFTCFFP